MDVEVVAPLGKLRIVLLQKFHQIGQDTSVFVHAFLIEQFVEASGVQDAVAVIAAIQGVQGFSFMLSALAAALGLNAKVDKSFHFAGTA